MGSFRFYGSYRLKDIHKIEHQQINRIIAAIENLALNPFPSQHRKLKK